MNFTMMFLMGNGAFQFRSDDGKMFENFKHFSKFCMNEVNEEMR